MDGSADVEPVPLDAPIVVRLSRPLLPASAVRQAVSVYSGQPGMASPFLAPHYDVLNRVLVYWTIGQFTPEALYQIQFAIPAAAQGFGLRAFDGTPLSNTSPFLRTSFVTSDRTAALPVLPKPEDTAEQEMPGQPQTEPPKINPQQAEPTCREVVELFKASCASSCCHGGAAPAMALALDSEEGLLRTAIGKVAHQARAPEVEGVPFVDPDRFGNAMAIIQPGSPATSYLVYKMLLLPENLESPSPVTGSQLDASAKTSSHVLGLSLPDEACDPLDEQERTRLSNWFVHGEAMPPSWVARSRPGTADCSLPSRAALGCSEFRRINRFIELGAHCSP
ncbi:MAG TPA: hypothetical protein VFQ61_22775 [Polyangiaceae bacterium]|nr:hypothetical protein [Polyangiaceae bacterium]